MSTYAVVKARIVDEMVRDDIDTGGDLEGQLTTHFARACEYYSDRKFWFNSIITTGATVANTQGLTIPAGVRIVERVTVPAYDRTVREVTLGELPDDTVYGLPGCYAYYNGTLRLYPIPDAVYTLNIYGVAQVDAPSTGSDTNIWTTEAQHLVVARVKKTLYAHQFRDAEGAQLAESEEREELDRLLRETSRRLEKPLNGRNTGSRYNINYE